MSPPITNHHSPLAVLGIESSCDETAAAIVSERGEILSNIVHSQISEHLPYGGVVPEIAARAHMQHIDSVIRAALAEANMRLPELSGIAATCGPGLIGGVIVGCMTGKALASVHQKPFIAVNHLEGHALTARLTHHVEFPYLLLLVSGGHCQFLICKGVGDYIRLGGTLDDALGEAFDKCAKMLGLGYPGGPMVEQYAREGNPNAYPFPTPLQDRKGCDFSFSGLKTAVRAAIIALRAGRESLSRSQTADICASFQWAAFASVQNRLEHAVAMFHEYFPHATTLVVAGGVAANAMLAEKLTQFAATHKLTLVIPPAKLCTDNAAMIAWVGVERLRLNLLDGLDFEPRPRWPLAE